MKIQSKFYDFYDHLQYDNDDPHDVVFRRLDSTFDPFMQISTKDEHSRNTHYNRQDFYEHKNKKLHHISPEFTLHPSSYKGGKLWVCNRTFELTSDLKINTDIHPSFDVYDHHPHAYDYPKFNREMQVFKAPAIVHLNLFQGKRYPDSTIYLFHPRLEEFGLNLIVSPEELFFHIENYLRTFVFPSPDSSPSSPMTNKEKIVSHGFDTITSFRGSTRK